MNKFERIFYFIIILAEFVLILLFYTRLNDCWKKQSIILKDIPRQTQRLYSFPGKTATGEQQWVHFSAYSPHYYILVTVSPQCPHCNLMIEHLDTFFTDKTIADDIKVILATSDEWPKMDMKVCEHPDIRCLKIAYDDWVQLGIDTPSIFVTNGKGDILYNQKGYSPGLLDAILEKIAEHKNKSRKSKSID
jgi:hypothetical protein